MSHEEDEQEEEYQPGYIQHVTVRHGYWQGKSGICCPHDHECRYESESGMYYLVSFDNGGWSWVAGIDLTPAQFNDTGLPRGACDLNQRSSKVGKFAVTFNGFKIGEVNTGVVLPSGRTFSDGCGNIAKFVSATPMLDKFNGSTFDVKLPSVVKTLKGKGWSQTSINTVVRTMLPTRYESLSNGWSDEEVSDLTNELLATA